MRRRPADFSALTEAVNEALVALKKSRPRFRRTRYGWKVIITLRYSKNVISVRVRDRAMLQNLKDWLDKQQINFEQARRFGGKESPERIYVTS